MRGLRGLVAAVVVGGALYVFMAYLLHGNQILTLAGSVLLGVAILAIVATQGDEGQVAADAAWREAAPDLPPVSDRVELERERPAAAAWGSTPRPRRPATRRTAPPMGGSAPPAGVRAASDEPERPTAERDQ